MHGNRNQMMSCASLTITLLEVEWFENTTMDCNESCCLKYEYFLNNIKAWVHWASAFMRWTRTKKFMRININTLRGATGNSNTHHLEKLLKKHRNLLLNLLLNLYIRHVINTIKTYSSINLSNKQDIKLYFRQDSAALRLVLKQN